MSLVVAQATKIGPYVVSDTRVERDDGMRPAFKHGALKAIVVSPTLTLCFAGYVARGMDGIRRAAHEFSGGAAIDLLVALLRDASADALAGNRPVDFLLAVVDDERQVCRVRDGDAEWLPVAWIGDVAAFERFQQSRNAPLDDGTKFIESILTETQRLGLAMRRAMSDVIADPNVTTVGDFCVVVAPRDGAFNYCGESFVHVGRDIQIQSGDLIAQMAQPVEEGGYTVCMVPPAAGGTAAFGLCFPVARIAMVYEPLRLDGAVVLEDVGPNEFVERVQREFGIRMSEPLLRYR